MSASVATEREAIIATLRTCRAGQSNLEVSIDSNGKTLSFEGIMESFDARKGIVRLKVSEGFVLDISVDKIKRLSADTPAHKDEAPAKLPAIPAEVTAGKP